MRRNTAGAKSGGISAGVGKDAFGGQRQYHSYNVWVRASFPREITRADLTIRPLFPGVGTAKKPLKMAVWLALAIRLVIWASG